MTPALAEAVVNITDKTIHVGDGTTPGGNPLATKAYVDANTSEVLQQVRTQVTTTGSTSTAIPQDNTIPQNSEGAEFLSLSITPKVATSVLMIEVNFYGGCFPTYGSAGAIFKDSDVNAIWAGGLTGIVIASNDSGQYISIKFFVPSASVSARTYRFRAGPINGGGTFYFNCDTSGALFGGVSYASMAITELAA